MNQPRIVEVALRNQHEAAIQFGAEPTHRIRQLFEYVLGFETGYGVYGIETQTVEAVITQPHQGIVDDETPYLIASRTVIVDRLAPRGLHAVREIGAVTTEIIAVRTQVVVHDIEQCAEALL